MMDKSDEERVAKRAADAYWPLIPFFYGQLYGCSIGRIMAHFFGCQPPSIFKARVAELELELDNREAFLSPTWRRRRRDEKKRAFKNEINEARQQGVNVRQIGKETLSQMCEGIREALQGSNIEELSNGEIKADWPPVTELDLNNAIQTMDISRIPKFSELEMRQRQEVEEMYKQSEEIAQQFPMRLTVDARLRNELFVQVGGSDGYAFTIAGILAEIMINPESIKESPSAIKTSLRVFPIEEELNKTAELPQAFRVIGRMIGRFMVLSMTPQGEGILRKMVGNMLVDQLVGQPYTKYKKQSLEELDDMGVLPADSDAEEVLSRMEERSVLESALEQLPASQREDCRLLLQAGHDRSAQELRDELGEKQYKSKQRNFERARKTLETLRKSGRLEP